MSCLEGSSLPNSEYQRVLSSLMGNYPVMSELDTKDSTNNWVKTWICRNKVGKVVL